MTRGPEEIIYTTLLDFPAPMLKANPRVMVVAEKYEAMVMLGIANSRMKDSYDFWTLARQLKPSGPALCAAIRATFEQRGTALPESLALALTAEFAEHRRNLAQSQAFVRKSKLLTSGHEGMDLPGVANGLQAFVMPPKEALVRGTDFEIDWLPARPWRPRTTL